LDGSKWNPALNSHEDWVTNAVSPLAARLSLCRAPSLSIDVVEIGTSKIGAALIPRESAAPISRTPRIPKVGAVIRAMNCDIRWAAFDNAPTAFLLGRPARWADYRWRVLKVNVRAHRPETCCVHHKPHSHFCSSQVASSQTTTSTTITALRIIMPRTNRL
jgi:hypothetical protein